MLKVSVLLCFCLVVISPACSSSNVRETSVPSDSQVVPQTTGLQSADDGIAAIATREIIRRQEKVRRADAAALRANKYSSEGDHEAAVRSYRRALDTLPSSE